MKTVVIKYLKNKASILVVIFVAMIFFISISSYNFITQKDDFVKWASPDETANYVFTKLYGQTGEIFVFEKYNLYVQDIMHPRSIRSDYGNLKPVSFLGIIIVYGKIASVFGYKLIPYMTPFFAVIGLIFYYLLIKKIFGPRNALYSTLILAVFPVYTYYSVRSMFHNILFMVFLIVGLYFGVIMMGKSLKTKFLDKPKLQEYKKWLFAAASGFFIGLSVITRTSELLWIAPGLLLIWIFYVREIGITKLILFLCGFFLALIPMIFWNQILYGSPTSGGYPEMNASIYNATQASGEIIKNTAVGQLSYAKDFFFKFRDSVFVFGFHPKQSFLMFKYYVVEMFPWLFWIAMLGFILFAQKINKWRKKHFVFVLSYLLISSILIMYYGSWEFHDNPNPDSITIGNSYTRYWLPIYLGLIPLFSLFITKITRAIFSIKISKKATQLDLEDNSKSFVNSVKKQLKWPNKKILINGSRVIVMSFLFFSYINFVLHGSEEGLLYSVSKNIQAREELRLIEENTEGGSVIITRYHDKLFFPERKVIVGLFDDNKMNELYTHLLNYVPVYYYNFSLPEKDLEYLNNRKFLELKMSIVPVAKVTKDFTLYRLNKIEP